MKQLTQTPHLKGKYKSWSIIFMLKYAAKKLTQKKYAMLLWVFYTKNAWKDMKQNDPPQSLLDQGRLLNCNNPYQGTYTRVLIACSAGLLRSASTSVILTKAPYNFNTRAVGVDPYNALIPVDQVLIEWADLIICMDLHQKTHLEARVSLLPSNTNKQVINLDIPDRYAYRDPRLMKLIRKRLKERLPK